MLNLPKESSAIVTPYLIFKLRESLYAIEALAVCEIILLPEIAPLEETPDYILGVINLRGQIVPIIDLNRRFGYPAQRCRLEDSIIILEQPGITVGLVVNEVQNIRDLAPNEQLPVPSYGTAAQSDVRFLTGLANLDDQVVRLLHLENLLRLASEAQENSVEETLPSALPTGSCLEATPEESAILAERARSLAPHTELQEPTERLPLAVVRLNGEFFGIALRAVQEFADVSGVTPVPCCPDHIIGQMNLRGDLITLVDIADTLGLPPARARADCKVVVVNDAELRVGVLVDEVVDVLYLNAADMSPTSVTARASGQEYRQGTAAHGSQTLSLLDLPALLTQERLLVNETP